MIQYQCAGCKQRIRARDEWAGKKARCPRCGQVHKLPRSVAATPGGAAPANDPNEMESVLYVPPGKEKASGSARKRASQQEMAGGPSAFPPTLASPQQPGAVRYACGACGQALVARTTDAGKKARCPRCSRVAKVPSPDSGELQAGVLEAGNYRGEMESLLYNPASDPLPQTMPGNEDTGTHHEPVAIAGCELIAELGRGAMGVVYKAWQRGLKRTVALKMVLAGSHAGPQLAMRLRREAELVARLQHPNIIQIYEVGERDGLPFLTLEYADGGNLAQKTRGKPVPERQAAQLVERLARAVAYAHENDVVHRDLKPANVLLVVSTSSEAITLGTRPEEMASFEPRITDFGLAKHLDEVSTATVSGTILGTPNYMAPEQGSGKSKDVGPAADIHALGAILYDLLTGRPPYLAATMMLTLEQLLTQEPVPPRRLAPQLSPDLETICLKCLEKEPGKRYASALELAEDLRRFLAGEPIKARPAGVWRRGVKLARRRPAVAALAAVLLVSAVSLVSLGLWAHKQLRDTTLANAEAQVNTLLKARAEEVSGTLQALENSPRQYVLPLLRRHWENRDLPEQHRMRAGLALLRLNDPQVKDDPVEPLRRGMLEAKPHEMLLIRDTLQLRHAEQLTPEFWKQADDPNPERKFRALVVLAAFDPGNERWDQAAAEVVDPLLNADSLDLKTWTEALRPVRLRLLTSLGKAFRDPKTPAVQRQSATDILADYAADQPKELVDLALDAEPWQYLKLWPHLQQQREQGLTWLNHELFRTPANEGKDARAEDRERLARRKAQAAVSLYRFGMPDLVWQRLRFDPDPRLRTYLVHRLGQLGADPVPLVTQLNKERDVGAQRALILSLGEFTEKQLPEEVRRQVTDLLVRWYGDDPDPGIHSAIAWLVGQGMEGPEKRKLDWKQGQALREIDREFQGKPAVGNRRWYVTRQGQTMVVLPLKPGPIEFLMGSPSSEEHRHENETQHRRVIGRSFAIGSTKVTYAQFRKFLDAHPEVKHEFKGPKKYDFDPNLPILSVTWYEAAQYCNWLSKQEGIPEDQWCYPSIEKIEKSKDGITPLELPADYLRRTGYRLPSEAEWEYACRADSTTGRFFGSSNPELSLHYAWSEGNAKKRPWPVALKKPNDFGLFDTYGNGREWCQNGYGPYLVGSSGRVEDREDIRPVLTTPERVRRSGGVFQDAKMHRSAARNYDHPVDRDAATGFRVVRTMH